MIKMRPPLALLLLLTSITTLAADDEKVQVVFYAMGDMPYGEKDDMLLPKQIAELPNDAEFLIHLGDIKTGATPCDESVYMKVAGMLAKSKPPVFIIPGDNEWNDCMHPDKAWLSWKRHFMRFDRRWKHGFRTFRQLEREENFSFVRGNVLFIGINIVGGRIHDADEWKKRHAQDLEWTRRNLRQFGATVSSVVVFGHALPFPKHNDFFAAFSKEAANLKKPVLYLHGDGHRWFHDRPFAAKTIQRVQVDQGGIAPPVKITITDHATDPFRFDRRK
jgi:hypothetical protein